MDSGKSPYVPQTPSSPYAPENYPPPPPYPVQPVYLAPMPAVSKQPKSPAPKPPMASTYKFTVCGRVKNFAKQFAIDIISDESIIFHMNVRFNFFLDPVTVFNSCTASGTWGTEERRNFNTLKRGASFVITIESRDNYFFVEVNKSEKYTFEKRLPEGKTCKLKLSKVDDKDVSLTGFELDF